MRLSHLRRATVSLLVAVGLCTAGSLALADSAQARVVAADGASYWHPFSNPVWYPLRGSDATMDCASHNPGCSGKYHKDQAVSLLSRTMYGTHPVYHRAAVYAAGAGILHIGKNMGNRCGSTDSLGTWIWIDHGAGIISRYGHLGGIIGSVHEGMYVTPDTIIGYTGHSGEKITGDCYRATNYLNFQIEHNGLYGNGVPLTTLQVCAGSRAVTWPSRVHSDWATFQNVPQHSSLNNGNNSATACVHKTWLTTPGYPHVRQTGHSGSTHTMWTAPAGNFHVRSVYVELREFHPANNTWSIVGRKTVSGGTSSTWFRGLDHHRVFRSRVSFYNAAGWSKFSGWHATKTA